MRNKVFKSGFWQLGNLAVNVVLQLLFYATMARELDKEAFGIVAIATSVSNLAYLLSSSGLGPALVQRRELEQGHLNATASVNFVISFILAFVIYFIAPLLAGFYNQPQLVPIIRVLGLSFIFQSIGVASNFMLQRELNFKAIFITEALSYILSYSIGFYLLFSGFGIWAIISFFVFNPFFNTIGYIAFTRKLKIRLWNYRLSHLKDLYSYGVGYSLGRITDYISNSGIMILVGKLIPLRDLGLFERSFRIMMLPGRYLGQVLQKVIFPGLARVNNDDEKIYIYYEKGLSLMTSIMLPLSILLIIYAKEVVHILLGPSWYEAVLPLQILFIPLAIRVSIRMCDSLMRAKGWVYRNTFFKLINTITLLTLIYIGHFWGVVGICIGVSFAVTFYFFHLVTEIKRRFNKNMSDILRPFSSSIRLSIICLIGVLPVNICLKMYFENGFIPMILSLLFLALLVLALFRWNKKVFGSETISLISNLGNIIRSK